MSRVVLQYKTPLYNNTLWTSASFCLLWIFPQPRIVRKMGKCCGNLRDGIQLISNLFKYLIVPDTNQYWQIWNVKHHFIFALSLPRDLYSLVRSWYKINRFMLTQMRKASFFASQYYYNNILDLLVQMCLYRKEISDYVVSNATRIMLH